MTEKQTKTKTIKSLLIEGRFLHSLRMLFFIPIFYFIYTEQKYFAFVLLSTMLLISWYNSFKLKHQDLEKPNYMLWFRISDVFLSLGVFSIMLYKALDSNGGQPQPIKMLIMGTIIIACKAIAYPLFTISLYKEKKKPLYTSIWSRLAILSINITMIIYVINLDNYRQIAMGSSILLMLASGISYIYWYYRDADHRKPLSVSNQLTFSRIILTPVFIWVFCYDSDLNFDNNHSVFQALAFLMVVTFMVTDFLDGYLARKWNEVSTLGKYLDPFSDKVSNMTIFMCFMVSGYASIWMVALIYFREASVETLRTLAANHNQVIPARKSGKWKTALQGVGILIILLFAFQPIQQNLPNWKIIWDYLPYSIMGIITFITIFSGIDYFWASRDIIKKYI